MRGRRRPRHLTAASRSIAVRATLAHVQVAGGARSAMALPPAMGTRLPARCPCPFCQTSGYVDGPRPEHQHSPGRKGRGWPPSSPAWDSPARPEMVKTSQPHRVSSLSFLIGSILARHPTKPALPALHNMKARHASAAPSLASYPYRSESDEGKDANR